ncbi:uncharacterized protein LOC143017484 [Oratosquilla oratoria]|uniref:uncharacterized protein LOC143017484 n=1 Tax=Oratosquilla oratoria TaxID=337810 RepID=UPI003F768AC5
MFRSKKGNKRDYHDSMNHITFKKWFLEQLLPNIPPRSAIIMNNAPYHNHQLEKASTSSRKIDIIKWLTEKPIPHDSTHTRLELLHLVKLDKKVYMKYKINDLAAAAGYKVIRLPPYYCQFNPIELMWGQIKQEIKKNNSNDKQQMKNIEDLVIKTIENVTPEDWRKCIQYNDNPRRLYEERS